MSDGRDARDVLRAWIAERVRGLEPAELRDDTALFENRYLTSPHVPELILLLERLRGDFIDIESLQPGDFRDIDTIAARFLAPEPSR